MKTNSIKEKEKIMSKDKIASININFDSLRWLFSENNFPDFSYFEIMDRFLGISNKMNFKYTIFVIGKDLKNPDVFSRVRELSEMGHEIGNHSYSHLQNLGYLDYQVIVKEVMKSHRLIVKCIREEPKGFISPAWNFSNNLLNVLNKANYSYDTSVFPSYFIFPVLLKAWWNFRNDERQKDIFQKKDGIVNLFASSEPYFINGLLELPLPTIFKFPCWHTTAFFYPKWLFDFVLNSCLKKEHFYYLVHPADLIGREDIPEKYKSIKVCERMGIPYSDKKKLLTSVLRIIKKKSKIITLKEQARRYYERSNFYV